jgi:hypothetical protein
VPEEAGAQPTCIAVASPAADPIADTLAEAVNGWAVAHDRAALRRRLLRLLMMVEG